MADGVSLQHLIARLPATTSVRGDAAGLVTAVESDSRNVVPGAVFVALRGARSDGHAFVLQALSRGAAAVVVESPPESVCGDAAIVRVPDTRRALSALAAAFYGDPSLALNVVGITGTNGKTTTVHMLQAILSHANIPAGAIGTVGASFETRTWSLAHTTPLPTELHALLAAMRDAGAAAVAMEVSSHALALHRADDVRFAVAALTNVTRDHLDFHETLDAYASAKRHLFSLAPHAVINADDACGARWAIELAKSGVDVTTYGERSGADMVAKNVEITSDDSSFSLDSTRFRVRIGGRFNLLNALAAIGAARYLGVRDATIAEGLATLELVPGRMQRLRDDGIEVVVDYAHTPDALHHALSALRETAAGAVTVVFGCGGDRDRGKRREMGAVSALLADRIYITSDNPRSEDPKAIADEIAAGIGDRPHVVELDRRRAIERAILQARRGDVVLVAGKGHETTQIVGGDLLPFDDATVARQALRLRGARASLK